MSSRVSPAMIGSFVVSGIVLVVAAVIIFGSGTVFDKKERFVAFFPGSVNGLTVGSNVAFRGVNVGSVRSILLAMGADTANLADSRVPVIFEVDETRIQARGASIDLSDPEEIQRLLEQGMSAQLDTESLLTGRLYVSLDFRPSSQPLLHGGDFDYPEIPTVGSPMAEVQEKIRELADRFSDVDLEAVFERLSTTLDGVNEFVTDDELQSMPANVNALVASIDRTSGSIRQLVESVDTSVGPLREQVAQATVSAEESMSNLNETLGSLQTVVDPSAPLVVGLVRTLEELELAARSLRRVSELLERDPAVLVRGRSTGGGS